MESENIYNLLVVGVSRGRGLPMPVASSSDFKESVRLLPSQSCEDHTVNDSLVWQCLAIDQLHNCHCEILPVIFPEQGMFHPLLCTT